MTVKEAADLYISKGWHVVPLRPKDKLCRDTDWIDRLYKPDDFTTDNNIGIKWDDGLVDVDCDSEEAVFFAATFLPVTGAVYGRPGKPNSHYIYRSDVKGPRAFKDFIDNEGKGSTVIEWRAGGKQQSMVPPSIHPSGEQVAWSVDDPVAAEVESDLLQRAVRMTATCAVVAKYYNPPGNRHDWCLALAGLLRKLGVSQFEMELLIEHAGKYAKDADLKDRFAAIRTTYDQPESAPLATGKKLIEVMSNGEKFVQMLRRIWGAAGGSGLFITDEKGKVIGHQENIRRALKDMEVVLSYDEFRRQRMVKSNGYFGPLDDAQIKHAYLEVERKYHFRPGTDYFKIVIEEAAWTNKYNPVKDYLQGLHWDGKTRLDYWLTTYAGAADNEYTRAIGAITLIAAVRRIMRPGCKFDEMLVLESEQGLNKSTALSTLCPQEEWFSDDLPLNATSKEVIERTSGKWIIEAAELSGLSNRPGMREHLKAFLSRRVDSARASYGWVADHVPRQFIIIGTTNDRKYLIDSTGNRRFWPCAITKFDVKSLLRDRDQLWAEAVYRETQGESIRLPESLWAIAAIQQERRRSEDPVEDILEVEFGGEEDRYVTKEEVWEKIPTPSHMRTTELMRRINNAMQRLGYLSGVVFRIADDDGIKKRGTKTARGYVRKGKKAQQSLPVTTENTENKAVND